MYGSFVSTADSQRRHNRLTAQRRDDEVHAAQVAAIDETHRDDSAVQAVRRGDLATYKRSYDRNYEAELAERIDKLKRQLPRTNEGQPGFPRIRATRGRPKLVCVRVESGHRLPETHF